MRYPTLFMWSLKQHESGQIQLVEIDLVQYDKAYAQSSFFFPRHTQELRPNLLKHINVWLINALVTTCNSKSASLMPIFPFRVSMCLSPQREESFWIKFTKTFTGLKLKAILK